MFVDSDVVRQAVFAAVRELEPWHTMIEFYRGTDPDAVVVVLDDTPQRQARALLAFVCSDATRAVITTDIRLFDGGDIATRREVGDYTEAMIVTQVGEAGVSMTMYPYVLDDDGTVRFDEPTDATLVAGLQRHMLEALVRLRRTRDDADPLEIHLRLLADQPAYDVRQF